LSRQLSIAVGTQNILDAAAASSEQCRVLVVGSAEEYGPNNGQPIPELLVAALQPLSPYAASKVAVERLIETGPAYRGLAIRTRSFPHIGPGQRRGFFVVDVASQLVAIERGSAPPVLLVGNLDPVRDYTDVRDVVRAYGFLL
jgi:GDP-4-dehydro-6-deoxy-D-mannose reductase